MDGSWNQVTFPVDHHQGSSIGPGTLNILNLTVRPGHPGPKTGWKSHWMMAVPQIFTLGNGWLEITQHFHPRQTIANVYVFGVKWNEYVSNNHLVWATSILKLLDASAVLVLFFSNIYYCIPFLSKHMGSFVLPKKHVMFLEIVSFQWLHHCNRRGKCVSTNP